MTAHVVCVSNMKGGVGKTTVGIAIAEGTAHIGRGDALVIDLDPQINASYVLAGATPTPNVPWRRKQTIIDYLEQALLGTPLHANSYAKVAHHLDHSKGCSAIKYISGSVDILTFERQQLVRPHSTIPAVQTWFLTQIDRLLQELCPHYALIVFDCPPGLSLLAEAAITRCDLILIPVVPTALSTMGLDAYHRYLQSGVGIADLQHRMAILKTMVTETNLGKEWSDAIDRQKSRYYVFKQKLSVRSKWAEAMDRGDGHTTFQRTYGNAVGADLEEVVHELWALLEKGAAP